ncbi:MAG: DUF4249 domain-containing protein [Chitinophagaceae bacterium]|nr:DUF4249 domain-containing protein [Chitinophagaceae bacterium]
MTRSLKNTAPALLILLLLQCKDPYVSPYAPTATGYLVVEGYITGNGPTRIMLSHTIPLTDRDTLKPEINAQLRVEGDDNSAWTLVGQGNGVYSIDTLPLNPAVKYRLRIHTAGNKDYLSDYAPFKTTPAIDSINWAIVGGGIDIYANTHDPSNATRYYQWDYDETWQYFSSEVSQGKYQAPPPSVVSRDINDQVYICWKSAISTSLLLGSTAKLAQDVVYRALLNSIPGGSHRLSYKYSTLVRQYALTEDAYNYLALMQKNSQSLGSIFDAQPVQLKGNIHCLSVPAEQVIGYISTGTLQQKRIFIDYTQIPNDLRYHYLCPIDDHLVTLDSLDFYFAPGKGYTPISEHINRSGMFDGWMGNLTICADCRAMGGVTTKPSFWPN